MIRLYTGEETFNWTADMDWITGQLACGGQIGSAAAMSDLKRQRVSHILNLSATRDSEMAEPFGIRVLDHYFADDLEPKSPDIFERGVNFARHALAKKENRLYVHCAARLPPSAFDGIGDPVLAGLGHRRRQTAYPEVQAVRRLARRVREQRQAVSARVEF